MENQFNNNEIKYLEAQKRVKDLKNFYVHLMIYFGFNLIIFWDHWRKSGENFKFEDGFNFYTGVLWGIVIIIHAVSIFLPSIKNWEKRKTRELMEKENEIS